jgi:hypothetical protein
MELEILLLEDSHCRARHPSNVAYGHTAWYEDTIQLLRIAEDRGRKVLSRPYA